MTIKMNKNVLVIVAHPDDETFGLGSTIKKHILDGDKVYVVSMTDGVGSRNNNREQEAKDRFIASENASKILGFEWENRLNFPDNKMDTIPLLDIVQQIEKIKIKLNPTIIYSHSPSDLNIDHRVLINAVLTAFRPLPNENCKEIRLFEVPSATDFGHENITGKFIPNLFIDISNTWEDKVSALRAYSQELRKYPHSRSIESIKSLAHIRGNQVGINMAEAFQIIRKVEV